VREIRMLRLTWRGLETWPWWNCEPIPQSKERDWKPSTYSRCACPRPYWRGAVGKGPQGTSLAAYPTARPVLNGGREETCHKVPRLAPTQHHHSGTVLAYVFGRRKDTVFLELQRLKVTPS
jgi:hypothetical protein